jgi:hypothetical protein
MTTVINDNEEQIVTSLPNEVTITEQPDIQVVTTTEQEVSVVTEQNESVVKSIDLSSSIISTGIQGPVGPQGIQGPKGDPGTGSTVDMQLPTNSIISGWKVIRADVNGFAEYASSSNISHADTVLGISTHSVTDNSLLNIRCAGYMEDSSWNWNIGKIFLGVNGTIQQSLPSNGFILQLGNAVSPTKININIKTSIIII